MKLYFRPEHVRSRVLSQKVKPKKKLTKHYSKAKQLMLFSERMERESDICERVYSKWKKRNNFNTWMSKHVNQVLKWKQCPTWKKDEVGKRLRERLLQALL